MQFREEQTMIIARSIVLAVGMVLAASAWSQQYPAKAVRLILPFPPGGGTDTIGRVVALKLSEQMGQQVVAENRPGAGANIGAEIAAKSPPDGYTLMVAAITHAIGQSLYKRLNFDLAKDFAHVTLMATTPLILVVHPSVPVKTVKEFVAFTKTRPGELAYSSSGAGSAAHLAGEYFASMAGIKMVHVPYKGGGPSMIALVGGEVSASVATMPSAIGHIRNGRLRGLAVSTKARSPAAPEFPTVDEAGVKGYTADNWYGLVAPAGTPAPVITRLHSETHTLLKVPDVKDRLGSAGFEVLTSTPDEYAAFTRSEVAKWGKVVKALGLRAD
jgi:tripartite-type tricarboxylate transporter receptor subunit TctC